MHRARHLARKGKRVLITSYNVALCEAIRRDITLLCDEAELERITVRNIDDEALQLCPGDQLPLDMDKSELFALRIKRATELLSKKGNKSPYDAVIVDETQDVDVSRLALIRLLAGKGRDSLTLLGDMNQRIYGEPLDLEDLHNFVEGRTFAPASGVSGPPPVTAALPAFTEEAVAVAMAILSKLQAGVPPDRIAVFARRSKRLRGARVCAQSRGRPVHGLDPRAPGAARGRPAHNDAPGPGTGSPRRRAWSTTLNAGCCTSAPPGPPTGCRCPGQAIRPTIWSDALRWRTAGAASMSHGTWAASWTRPRSRTILPASASPGTTTWPGGGRLRRC